eukprot:6109768-Amphidinium_carterae.1
MAEEVLRKERWNFKTLAEQIRENVRINSMSETLVHGRREMDQSLVAELEMQVRTQVSATSSQLG